MKGVMEKHEGTVRNRILTVLREDKVDFSEAIKVRGIVLGFFVKSLDEKSEVELNRLSENQDALFKAVDAAYIEFKGYRGLGLI